MRDAARRISPPRRAVRAHPSRLPFARDFSPNTSILSPCRTRACSICGLQLRRGRWFSSRPWCQQQQLQRRVGECRRGGRVSTARAGSTGVRRSGRGVAARAPVARRQAGGARRPALDRCTAAPRTRDQVHYTTLYTSSDFSTSGRPCTCSFHSSHRHFDSHARVFSVILIRSLVEARPVECISGPFFKSACSPLRSCADRDTLF